LARWVIIGPLRKSNTLKSDTFWMKVDASGKKARKQLRTKQPEINVFIYRYTIFFKREAIQTKEKQRSCP